MAQNFTTSYRPKAHLLAFIDALGFSKEVQRGNSTKVDQFFWSIRVRKALLEWTFW